MSMPAADEKTWVPLSHRERRVVGVLVEKQKTTPEYYPMSIAAIVTGCNQKSNRDPITNLDADDVEEALESLRAKGAAARVEGAGRVVKWRHLLYEWLGLQRRAVELAILAELLLRGPQTEGDLRARASRMDPIPDLDTLQGHLEYLAGRGLVVYLTPPGQRRGVVVTHNLYPPEELERVRQAHAHAAPAAEVAEAPAPAGPARAGGLPPVTPGWVEQIAGLRAEVEALRATVESLQAELRDFKASLGA